MPCYERIVTRRYRFCISKSNSCYCHSWAGHCRLQRWRLQVKTPKWWKGSFFQTLWCKDQVVPVVFLGEILQTFFHDRKASHFSVFRTIPVTFTWVAGQSHFRPGALTLAKPLWLLCWGLGFFAPVNFREGSIAIRFFGVRMVDDLYGGHPFPELVNGQTGKP